MLLLVPALRAIAGGRSTSFSLWFVCCNFLVLLGTLCPPNQLANMRLITKSLIHVIYNSLCVGKLTILFVNLFFKD
jgi:D-alanyl-lipoteichoic acid acyltransferase DltB (MBOAT superfamily)